MPARWKNGWPHLLEYLIEAAGLGLFMVSACGFAIALFGSGSVVVDWVPSPFWRRVLMGLAMGATAIVLIYSPAGQRSGAHFNPAVSLTYCWLGKISPGDACAYAGSQTLGAAGGVGWVALLAPQALADPAVNFAITVPGPWGTASAWATEFLISAVLMGAVLTVSNSKRWAPVTGIIAGCLIAVDIIWAAPISGMSMNPARTLGSALIAGVWSGWWIYLTAPPLGMLSAALLYRGIRGGQAIVCAKLRHRSDRRCIFCESRKKSGSIARTGAQSKVSGNGLAVSATPAKADSIPEDQ